MASAGSAPAAWITFSSAGERNLASKDDCPGQRVIPVGQASLPSNGACGKELIDQQQRLCATGGVICLVAFRVRRTASQDALRVKHLDAHDVRRKQEGFSRAALPGAALTSDRGKRRNPKVVFHWVVSLPARSYAERWNTGHGFTLASHLQAIRPARLATQDIPVQATLV